jgi:hypothetical protein
MICAKDPTMITGQKASLSFALWLLVMTPSIAADFTYKEYSKASEAWKGGFVFGIAQYLSTVAQPDEEPPYPVRNAYQQCLTGLSDVALARHVEAYLARNPPGPREPMIRVVLRAMFELCRSKIEQAQPPQRPLGR